MELVGASWFYSDGMAFGSTLHGLLMNVRAVITAQEHCHRVEKAQESSMVKTVLPSDTQVVACHQSIQCLLHRYF